MGDRRRVGYLAISLLAIYSFGGSSQANAGVTSYCRLDSALWLGCPVAAGKTAGESCGCPAPGGGAAVVQGHIRAAGDEQIVEIHSENAKVVLGISSIDGPVAAFVPQDLVEHRNHVRTAEQRHLLEIYDFFHVHDSGAPLWSPLTPARAFIRASDIAPPGLGGYGVVALRAKPTSANKERLGRVCQAFLASLPPQLSLPVGIPVAQQMITFWPVDDTQTIDASHSECGVLLDHYDLHGGLAAIGDADAQGNALAGQGPFLIGWSPSNSRYIKDAVVLVLDMSALETQASFDEVFLTWQVPLRREPPFRH